MTTNINDILQNLAIFVEWSSNQSIAIKWHFCTDIDIFLHEIEKNDFFQWQNTKIIKAENKKIFKKELEKITAENKIIIIPYFWLEEYEIQWFLGEKEIYPKIISFYTNETFDFSTDIFNVEEISFREFTKEKKPEIKIPEILGKKVDFQNIEKNFSHYILRWGFVGNLEKENDTIIGDFDKKCTIIEQELFEKEKDDFRNFIKTLAMEIWKLFKEDKIAKNLWISRRKIAKYVNLLLKYEIIKELYPYYEDVNHELSRHKKIYFSDLAFYRWAMWNNYAIGSEKIFAIENFVFLELSRKLDASHELYFWKKKSGTEVQFILKNKENSKLTPIEISSKKMKNISVTMKSFYSSYKQKIEHSMILTEKEIHSWEYEQKPYFILPYYTI